MTGRPYLETRAIGKQVNNIRVDAGQAERLCSKRCRELCNLAAVKGFNRPQHVNICSRSDNVDGHSRASAVACRSCTGNSMGLNKKCVRQPARVRLPAVTDIPVDVILWSSRKVIIDDQRNGVDITQRATECVIHHQAAFGRSSASIDGGGLELDHDSLPSCLPHVLVLPRGREMSATKRVSSDQDRLGLLTKANASMAREPSLYVTASTPSTLLQKMTAAEKSISSTS